MDTERTSQRIKIATTAVIAAVFGFCVGQWVVPVENSDAPGGESPDAKITSAPIGIQETGARSNEQPPDVSGKARKPGLGMRPPTSVEAEPERQAGRASLHRMLEQPGPISRWQDLMTFAETASPDEISGALAELVDMPGSIDTIVARFFLYSRFGEGDPIAAMAAIEGLPQGEIDLAKQSVLGGWAGKDPEAAAAYLLEQAGPDGELNDSNGRLVRNVVAEWSRKNPAEAFQWSLSLKGDGRKTGLETALRIWAPQDPATAAIAIGQVTPGEERNDAVRAVAEHWGRSDFDAATDWAATLPETERRIAIARAIASFAENYPQESAKLLAEQPPGEDRDQAMRTTASKWSQSDPLEAANWVASQPDNDAKRRAVRDVVRHWAREDETAASKWLNDQKPGPAKDSGIVALSNNVVADDPEAAAIWANAIGDEALRTLQVRSVIRNWMKKDRGAAFTWLQGADVSDAVKAEFFQR